ncbi:MAG: hypothetical protein HY562_09910 [Ignavibacteriales bacterium]|nr:hypothetical protein [Ignavibacteriales bacterium]
MRIGAGAHTYKWIDDWAKIPDTPSGRENGRTHGVVVTQSGNVIVYHQANPAVLIYDAKGKLFNTWGDRFPGAHGMTLVVENGKEFLWITNERSAEVVKTSLEGETLLNLQQPDLPAYSKGKYSPTWVAVCEERYGGNGDVWVADGYGMSYVHRFDKTGNYLASINGSEGKAGPFNCPHGIWMDARSSEPQLYIADRGNKRFQVYDPEGKFKRSFGSDFLTSPCMCIAFQGELFVPELTAKLTVLDANDRLICRIGNNEAVCNIEGWPNHPKTLIKPGKFNSPHSIAIDASGNLYVVEWIIGGRVTKLEKC